MKLGKLGKLEGAPRCPHCHKDLDGYNCTEGDHSPNDGDFSICAYCHHLLIFQQNENHPYLSLCYASVDDYLTMEDFPFKIVEHRGRIVVMNEQNTPGGL